MIRFLSITVATVITFTNAATAQDIPRYDVAGHCAQVAAVGGAPSEVARNGCIQMEQAAYDNLKRSWSAFPAPTRAHCNRVATFSGPGSYNILKGCIDMEQAARGTAPSFKY